jgi:hypothetical protein
MVSGICGFSRSGMPHAFGAPNFWRGILHPHFVPFLQFQDSPRVKAEDEKQSEVQPKEQNAREAQGGDQKEDPLLAQSVMENAFHCDHGLESKLHSDCTACSDRYILDRIDNLGEQKICHG